MVELVILLFVVLAVACFGLLLMFALCRAATRRDMLEARWREEPVPWVRRAMRAHETLERAGRHGGFPARGPASGLLAACPSDGSHDFYLSMMLDVPVPRVPVLRARLQDSRRGGAA